MLVFRDCPQFVCARTLVRELSASLARLESGASDARLDLIIDALLRSGELECGLADAASPSASDIMSLTDLLADALIGCGPARAPELSFWVAKLEAMTLPERGRVSPPEGFAYYALHPLAYALKIASLDVRSKVVAVIGIRSIGTTLSAIAVAAARRLGWRAERITVRPNGHPFDRQTDFTGEQLRWLATMRESGAEFVVVDEGPGLSGSSLLSVGEALRRARVERERITLMCSHEPDLASLVAPRAAERWADFRSAAVDAHPRIPEGAVIDIGGGRWREHCFADRAQWPAVWPQMERVQYLAADRRTLFRFEGLGRFGSEVLRRARTLADAGYAPPVRDAGNGFAAYDLPDGRPCTAGDTDDATLRRIAEYCAFRRAAFPAPAALDSAEALRAMVVVNIKEEFGIELPESLADFKPVHAVIVDGQMSPHEWLRRSDGAQLHADGTLLKMNAASHGDDHFFPGPTDIAWDLAGCIVEWQLAPAAAEFFLAQYQKLSGDEACADDECSRLPFFLLAYAAFRLGFCRMAAAATRDSDEESRLLDAAARYRGVVEGQLAKLGALVAASAA